MPVWQLIVITTAVVIGTVGLLRVASFWNERTTTLAGRRRAGVLQILRWAVLGVGALALAGEGLVAAGAQPATMAVFAAAGASGLAFAMREPLADFLAAASLLIERTAVIGDEVELNETTRGRLVGFGLRSVAVITWDGDTVYHAASSIRTLRNISKGTSRAVVDIDVPTGVRVGRATAALTLALSQIRDRTWQSEPEVLGVVAQHLDRYVVRISCIVDPAQHTSVEYRLKAAAVDAVAMLLEFNQQPSDTAQLLAVIADQHPGPPAATP